MVHRRRRVTIMAVQLRLRLRVATTAHLLLRHTAASRRHRRSAYAFSAVAGDKPGAYGHAVHPVKESTGENDVANGKCGADKQ